MKRRITIAGLLLLGLFTLCAMRHDARLIGVYVPDAEQTHSRWLFGKTVGLDGVKGVLSQIFNHEPVRITDRSMIFHTDRGIETNRLWILLKGTEYCTVYLAPASIFRFEIVNDGLWFVRRFGIPKEEYPLIVKLTKQNNDQDESESEQAITEREEPSKSELQP